MEEEIKQLKQENERLKIANENQQNIIHTLLHVERELKEKLCIQKK